MPRERKGVNEGAKELEEDVADAADAAKDVTPEDDKTKS